MRVGAHDEWTFAQKISARHRADAAYDTGNPMPTRFDGRAVSRAEAEQPMSSGYAGSCTTP